MNVFRIVLSGLLAAALSSPVFANDQAVVVVQAQADQAAAAVAPDQGVQVQIQVQAQPGVQVQVQAQPAAPPAPTQKVTYLGVSTSPLSPAQAAQLTLPEGFGLVIDHVQPDSPAAKAGAVEGDVIRKLGDQLIVNTAQMGALIRSHKSGDEVALTVLRDGQSVELKAALGEQEVPVNRLEPGAAGLRWRPATGGVFRLNPNQGVTRFADGEHDLTLRRDNDGKHLVAKDKDGKVIFDGPVETEAQRKTVPDALREKLDNLEKSAAVQVVPFPGGELRLGTTIDLESLKKELEKQLQDFKFDKDVDVEALHKRIEEMKEKLHRELKKQIEELQKQQAQAPGQPANPALPRPAGPRPFPGNVAAQSSATASYSDGEHTLTLRIEDDSKRLTVTDKTGKEMFEGPVNTDEQRQAVPQQFRAKLKVLESSMQIRVRILGPDNLPAKPEKPNN